MTIHVAAPWTVLAVLWAITVGIPAAYFTLRAQRLSRVDWVSFGVLVLATLYVTIAATTARVVADDRAITFAGWFLGSTLNVADVDFQHAVHFDAGDPNARVRPVERTWGLGMPGYRAGTFELANGERALVLTTTDDDVYVPTRHEPFVVNAAVYARIVASARTAAN